MNSDGAMAIDEVLSFFGAGVDRDSGRGESWVFRATEQHNFREGFC